MIYIKNNSNKSFIIEDSMKSRLNKIYNKHSGIIVKVIYCQTDYERRYNTNFK